MPAPAHVAASDCERCRPGLVAQPVNAMSSLAFVATGIALVAGADRAVGSSADAAVGWAAVAAGLGSVAYHGPGTSAGRYVHDATLVGLLATVVVADASRITGRPAHRGVLAAVPVLALVGAVPRWSMHTQAVVGVAATVSESVRIAGLPSTTAGRWRHRVAGVVAGAGAMGHVLGRSGGPWCRPDSRLQPHALWHAAMAVTLGLRALDPPS
ncbi:MAG TPA: hypothetical protein PKE56_13270 [Acidimicrobiales bacterium]|nr:hypothetical protein [Acidimicrobiales bacterium]